MTENYFRKKSLLKIGLLLAMVILKEARATDANATLEEKCANQYGCVDSLELPSVCRCDEICSFFGDCCPTSYNTKFNFSGKFECSSSSGVILISVCPNTTDFELKEMCESDGSSSPERSLTVPVIDVSSRFTYRNYYCAECNGVDEKNILFWNVSLYCPNIFNLLDFYSESELKEMVQYDEEGNKWGIYVNQTEDKRFYSCHFHAERPQTPELSLITRICEAGLIDSCSDTWEDKDVEQKCHIIQAPVFLTYSFLGPFYKNIYCAICNHVSLDDISCFRKVIKPVARFPVESFSILLDLNAKEEKQMCKEGEVYFNNKCRELVCGHRNLVFRNGKCVFRRRRDPEGS